MKKNDGAIQTRRKAKSSSAPGPGSWRVEFALAVSLLLFGFLLCLGCGQPAAKSGSRAESKPAPAQPVAGPPRSFEALKDEFLRRNEAGNVDEAFALFYTEGASPRIQKMYRSSIPAEDGLKIIAARIEDITPKTETKIPHTLKPEKTLVLEFDKRGQGELLKVSQFFFMGRKDNGFFFTLPSQ